MSLQVISIDRADRWDEIVCSFQQYDVYYLSGYAKAFQLHGDGEPLLFYYDDGDTKAINVVMKRDVADDVHFLDKLPRGEYYDFITPYGYGGFIIEGENTDHVMDEYEGYCATNGIICEFVRFHPVIDNVQTVEKWYEIKALGSTIAMETFNENDIWQNFSSKNRNMIRKAEKSNVIIANALTLELLDIFKKMYNATMNKDNASKYYYFDDDFYQSIYDKLPNNATVFYATHDNQIISMSIVIFAGKFINYHLSASIAEQRHLAPTNILLYKAACWGCEHGFTSFHLGGGLGANNDSLYSFKKSFYRGAPRAFLIGRKIFCQQKYEHLIKMRNETEDFNNSSFFPLYRA